VNPSRKYHGADLLELRLGDPGTLLAVPMLVVVKAFCDRIEDLKPIGELLGE